MGLTYPEIIDRFDCSRCEAPAGTPCRDLAVTSEVRHTITPHRERLRLGSSKRIKP